MKVYCNQMREYKLLLNHGWGSNFFSFVIRFSVIWFELFPWFFSPTLPLESTDFNISGFIQYFKTGWVYYFFNWKDV